MCRLPREGDDLLVTWQLELLHCMLLNTIGRGERAFVEAIECLQREGLASQQCLARKALEEGVVVVESHKRIAPSTRLGSTLPPLGSSFPSTTITRLTRVSRWSFQEIGNAVQREFETVAALPAAAGASRPQRCRCARLGARLARWV